LLPFLGQKSLRVRNVRIELKNFEFKSELGACKGPGGVSTETGGNGPPADGSWQNPGPGKPDKRPHRLPWLVVLVRFLSNLSLLHYAPRTNVRYLREFSGSIT
jgi:hypothetical protein